jgi:hypothetical protein
MKFFAEFWGILLILTCSLTTSYAKTDSPTIGSYFNLLKNREYSSRSGVLINKSLAVGDYIYKGKRFLILTRESNDTKLQESEVLAVTEILNLNNKSDKFLVIDFKECSLRKENQKTKNKKLITMLDMKKRVKKNSWLIDLESRKITQVSLSDVICPVKAFNQFIEDIDS